MVRDNAMAPETSELEKLREECRVMRNLLRDISQNENFFYHIPFNASADEMERAVHTRSVTRRALVDEVDIFLAAKESERLSA